jgi:phage tail-like protein
MAPGQRNSDPFGGFMFRVEIAGITVGGFSEVSGLQAEVEVEDYREGGLNEYMHRLAGPARYPNNLVLKHGITAVDDLWVWHQNAVHGKIERKDVAIVLLDRAGNETWRWTVNKACPVRWVGPELRANTAEVAVETLELVHHGISK